MRTQNKRLNQEIGRLQYGVDRSFLAHCIGTGVSTRKGVERKLKNQVKAIMKEVDDFLENDRYWEKIER